jgi:ketosteroid isomerase-like protein
MSKRFAAVSCLLIVFLFYGFPNSDSPSLQKLPTDREVIDKLAQISEQFSAAYVQGNVEKLVSFYTEDAVIFPGNSDLIRGREAIQKYWTLPPGRTITHHKITSVEVKIMSDFAYDYGYYEVSGSTDGEVWGPAHGKYLIVWKRIEEGEWKMHLDMWNSRPKPE